MLCQICQQNQADTFAKRRNGRRVEILPVCAACAERELLRRSAPAPTSSAEPRCPVCGSTLSEVLSSGLVGCSRCYAVFADQLRPTLTEIHGRTAYRGRVPAVVVSSRPPKASPVAAWREQLKAAILEENYEQAVVLRDKIRSYQRREREQLRAKEEEK